MAGPEHPKTITDMDHLGVTYLREGKLAQAEETLSQAAEMARRAWGPEHQRTLGPMIDLALVYAEQGRWAQAEALDAHILESERRGLGPEHPEVLRCRHRPWMSNAHLLHGPVEPDGRWRT